jgi:PAS domain S-box-containing protein
MKEQKLEEIINASPFGFAHHEIVLDESGKPFDYRFIHVNSAFESLTGISADRILANTFLEIVPELKTSGLFQIELYGTIALNGGSEKFEYYAQSTNRWYQVSVYSNIQGYFTTTFTDITEQKNLLEDHNVYVSTTPIGIFVANAEGRYIEVNPVACSITGYEMEELLQLSISDLIVKEEVKKAYNHFKEVKAGKIQHSIFRTRRKNGEVFWMSVAATQMNDHFTITYCQDISERKQAEEELEETALRLSLATKAGGVGVWDWNCLDNSLICDDQMYVLYGIDKARAGLTFDYWFGKIHPDDIQQSNQEIQAALDGIKEFDTEFRVVREDGSVHHIRALATVQRDKRGKPLRMIGTNWDITEQKKAEKRISALSNMQRTLTEISNSFINVPLDQLEVTINNSLRFMGEFTNADRAYIFDYDFKRNISCNTYEWCRDGIVPQKDELQAVPIDVIPDFIETHKAGRSIVVPDVLALPEESELRAILEPQGIKSMIGVPLMNEGVCIGFVGFDAVLNHYEFSEKEEQILRLFAQMLVNVENRRTAQDRLILAIQEAESASKAKSEFLANMSHEIRTPLNGVIGFTDLLKTTPLNDIQSQYVNNANVAGLTLLGIINDILDFSKIEAGMLELDPVKTDLIELLENCVDLVKFSAGKKNLEVLLNIDSNLPRYARVDPVRLKQILSNLVDNAVKFTDHGEVELKVDYQAKSNKKGKISFVVRDTGIGIDKDKLDKLFKAFSQADSSTTRQFGGTGLGLFISDKIAQKMNGTIQVESTPGIETKFSFELVLETESSDNINLSDIDKLKRCLIIDDNKHSRDIIQQILRNLNIESDTSSSGLEAIKKLEVDSDYDLVLCDYEMPGLNGIETIRTIRKALNLSNVDLPVILLHSANENNEIQEYCDEMGIHLRLIKPLKRTDLFSCLTKLNRAFIEELVSIKPPAASPLIEENRYRILVVEDTPMNMILIKALIPQLVKNIQIVEAMNGLQAIEIYQRDLPDLILMDIQMPIIDGMEATERIRKIEQETKHHVPIIALTAGALKEEMEKCLAAGMDDFLTKPIDPETTKTVIEKHLHRY